MTRDEGIFRRWSRRKQAAKAARVQIEAQPPVLPEPAAIPEAELPPLESLGAASDYTAFLRGGIAAEVQRRALQVAWQSDERIAGFRGMAEYAWDFNAPEYGRLWATDDVVRLVREALNGADEPPAPAEQPPATAEAPAAAPAEDPGGSEVVADVSGQDAPTQAEVAQAEPAQQSAGMRRHGSALPSYPS